MTNQCDDVAKVEDGLTAAHREFVACVADNRGLKLATREEDRIRQKCRKLGLVKVLSNPRRWAVTDTGRAYLQQKGSSHD